MRKLGMVVVCFAFMAVSALSANAQEAAGAGMKAVAEPQVQGKEGPQTVCPVSGRPINKEFHVDYAGRRVYFCGPNCVKTFKEDPRKWIGAIEAKGIVLEKVNKPQTICPVMGGKIDPKQFVDVEGFRIYVCCPDCVGKVKAEPSKYIKKILDSGEMPKVRLVVCPKCGEIRGTAKCCVKDAAKCPKCGLDKDSPGCCRMPELLSAMKTVKPSDQEPVQTYWTCSMHPEVKMQAAGKCPKCGMPLVQAKAEQEIVLCPKCGQVKGSTKCCSKDAALCEKCGLQKGSPLCCKVPKSLCETKCGVSCAGFITDATPGLEGKTSEPPPAPVKK